MDSGGVNAVTVANNVWTNASRTLTPGPSGFSGPAIQGYTVASAISLTSIATTNCVNFSGAGGSVIDVIIDCTTTLTGSPTIAIEVVCDGTLLSIPIFTTSLLIPNWVSALADQFVSSVTTQNGYIRIRFGFQFATSLRVGVNVSVAATAGVWNLRALWSHS